MNKQLYNSVFKLISDIMEKESPQWVKKKGKALDKNNLFMESLEVDSFLALELVSKIEKKFGISIKEEEFVNLDSIENIVNFIDKKKKG